MEGLSGNGRALAWLRVEGLGTEWRTREIADGYECPCDEQQAHRHCSVRRAHPTRELQALDLQRLA